MGTEVQACGLSIQEAKTEGLLRAKANLSSRALSHPVSVRKGLAECIERFILREVGKVGSLITNLDQSPRTQEGGLSKSPSPQPGLSVLLCKGSQ